MKFIGTLALMLTASFAMADGFPISIANKVASTSTVVSASAQLKGYVESIYVDITGTTTGALTVTSGDETLLSVTVTADTTYRPRYVTHNSTGGELIGGTNGYARYLLNTEALTFTLAETAGVTNTYLIKVKTDRDRP